MSDIVRCALKQRTQDTLHALPMDSSANGEGIMRQNAEFVRGFVCDNSHQFWTEWFTPDRALYCPICGSTVNHRRTWDGMLNRE